MIEIGAYHYYFVSFALFLTGLYVMIDDPNLIKKIIGLNLTQIAVYLMLVIIGYVDGASPPIIGFGEPYANPLVHVLVLTAIVVGVALTAMALALTIRLYVEFETLNVNEIETAIAADDTTGGSKDD